MQGHWQKTVPTKSGKYWVADIFGDITGPATVVYDDNGKRIMAGLTPNYEWGGWWWSEPIELPPPAPRP